MVFQALLLAACVDEPPPLPPPLPIAAVVRPDEKHLSDIVQLTFEGNNTVGRWSWASKQVVLQTVSGPQACDRIVRVDALASPPATSPVKLGQAPSFLPGDDAVLYARTPKCTKPPPESKDVKGRFLDPDLDLYRSKADGTGEVRLTATPGYDAEASVCGKDGSIVFTSTRDGDLDLYRMDADGGNVRRITSLPGYDGAAAYDADCTHIVWVASRPRGRELDDYKKQLTVGRLAPVTSDLWVANADGTDARQVTYLESNVSAPTWYPRQPRILFTSGVGSDNPRDVNLWSINLTGASLERITTAPGYDGAPSFSPDGKWLAFSSARATLLGQRDVNVFIAKWGGASEHVEERPADHLLGDSAWLADKQREGRGLGTHGLDDAGAYVERSFKSFGLLPIDEDGFRQEFDATISVSAQASFSLGGGQFNPRNVRAFGFSSSIAVEGPLTFIGSNDDFAHVDVKGKNRRRSPAGALEPQSHGLGRARSRGGGAARGRGRSPARDEARQQPGPGRRDDLGRRVQAGPRHAHARTAPGRQARGHPRAGDAAGIQRRRTVALAGAPGAEVAGRRRDRRPLRWHWRQ